MKKLALASILFAPLLAAQQHELGLTLGRIGGVNRSAIDLASGTALQANYGYRVWNGESTAVYGEVHFLANPQRQVSSANGGATRDVATLFVTPGVRVKFRKDRAVSPWLAAGGGYALYEQSLTTLSGAANPAPRLIHRGAFDFGGGADFRFWRFVALRAEVRDFYTGPAAFNVAAFHGGQHNLVVGGGIVLKFH